MDALHRHDIEMTEDSVDQMLVLAERLREQMGGELDESAIQAVSEATGAPIEYVRLAVKLKVEKEKKTLLGGLRAQFLTLGPETRRYVFSGIMAAFSALFATIGERIDQVTEAMSQSDYGLFGMVAVVCIGIAAYNAGLARDAKTASVSGAIFGAGGILMSSLFSMAMGIRNENMSEWTLIPAAAIGAVVGLVIFKIVDRNRSKLGLKDPVKDRQDLLRQMMQLQQQLTSHEMTVTFLSLDVVGSTRMKQNAKPLEVEFTFNEYHDFVDRLAHKYGGRIHSTAGDGIICAFDNASQAFGAAKNIQAGLIELNTFRNKIGTPIVLRAGIHSGTVMAPEAGDVTTVEFAHVIDMTAHIQKACPPGGIAVSSFSIAQLAGGYQAVGSDRVTVMDVEAAVWLPRQAMSLAAPSGQALPEGA